MSRIGKLPIVIPAGVTVTISGNEVKVKGPKGELVQTVSPEIKVEMVDGEIHVTRPNDEKQTRALHGARLFSRHLFETSCRNKGRSKIREK